MRRLLAATVMTGLLCGPALADEWIDRANCKPNRQQDYYPPKAIRLNQVGTVLVEFSVQGKGPPDPAVVVRATASVELRYAAIRVIRLMLCDPDPKWMDDGGPQRRIRLNVIFRLKGFEETPGRLDPDADEVVITGSPILRM